MFFFTCSLHHHHHHHHSISHLLVYQRATLHHLSTTVVGDAVKHKSKVKIHQKCFQHATNDMIIAGGEGTTVFTAR